MSIVDNSTPARDGVADRSVLGRGALAGASAWLVGYLVAYVWRADAVSETLRGVGFVSEVLGGQAVPAWKGVAWLFMNAHFVDTRFPAVMGGTRTVNVVTGEGSALALALPPVALAVAGALVAVGRVGTRTQRAAAGGAVALGYLPLSAATALFATHSIGRTGLEISPDPVTGILLAGVVYPVVFGAVGGVVAGELT